MGWAAPCCSSAIWKVNTMAMLERTGGSGCRLSRRSGWRHFCAQREGHTAPTPCEAGGQTARARACPERPPRPRGSDVTGAWKPEAQAARLPGRTWRPCGALPGRLRQTPSLSDGLCTSLPVGWERLAAGTQGAKPGRPVACLHRQRLGVLPGRTESVG